MSPDTRHHRGAHPADSELFSEDQLATLRRGVRELSWLLSRGYNMTSSLKLVGDRHGLRERQRLAVCRSACSEQDKEQRIAHRVAIEDLHHQSVIVDGFNLLITIEAALSKGPLFLGVDECIRDLSGVHGSYRSVEETEGAILMIGEALQELGSSSALWLLDQPVSNSGRLAAKIADLAAQRHWTWQVEVVMNPDPVIISSPAVAITSDSSILNQVERWTDLKSCLLKHKIPSAWVLDLSHV
ncbi:MAG TPA: DUF434 domain-containing protein [Pyrinomonadaceae bacterium]|nr:DUF434 domain-containing protein [Pyrinomonadaceae bacterium]